MAYELKQKGYTDVTIVERSNRVGGKAETFFYRQAEMPLAVVLWTSEYADTLVPLLEKFGVIEDYDSDVITNPASQNRYWLLNDPSSPAFNPTDVVTIEGLVTTLEAVDHYVDLHQEYLGIYSNEYGVSKEILV